MAKSAKSEGMSCTTCGHGHPLVFKNYEFWWMEGIDMEVSNLPEGSKIYIHHNFIIVDGAEKSQLQVPMHCIRFINLWNQEFPTKDQLKSSANPCEDCGQRRPLRYKGYQFFWMQGIDMEVSNLPEDSKIEMYDNFILVDGAEKSKLLVPMDCIRFINLWNREQ